MEHSTASISGVTLWWLAFFIRDGKQNTKNDKRKGKQEKESWISEGEL